MTDGKQRDVASNGRAASSDDRNSLAAFMCKFCDLPSAPSEKISSTITTRGGGGDD